MDMAGERATFLSRVCESLHRFRSKNLKINVFSQQPGIDFETKLFLLDFFSFNLIALLYSLFKVYL